MIDVVRYTGVGSRKVPWLEGFIMVNFAQVAAEAGYVLRSGHATGSDSRFEEGCDRATGQKEIYLPEADFNGSASTLSFNLMEKAREAEEIAAGVHPNWRACNDFARKAHARNVFQVLGRDLRQPSAFMVCWTPGGEVVGGTATAIKLAGKYGIPVYNIARPKARAVIQQWTERRAFDVWLGAD